MAEQTEKFLSQARKRFEQAAEEEKELRQKFTEDLKFASPDGDDQWDAQLKQQREAAGRPAMAFPRCHTFVSQVSNEARQKKPAIAFSPRLDDEKDTAEVLEGLARYIQYASDAQIAYETAIEYAAGASFGYYRFITDYVDADSDDLELKILPVFDPLTVYGIIVPASWGRRPKWAFVVEDIAKEEYEDLYPDSEILQFNWDDAVNKRSGWVTDNTVRVAEYWYVTEEKQAGKRRPKVSVKFCKTNGWEILEETDWPGSSIPIIPVLGKQMIQDGKPKLFSVVRPQKSAQMLLNYTKSRIAETLSLAPVSPWIAAEGQIDGYEAEWKNANTTPTAVLRYKQVDVGGRPAPPPQRQTFEPPINSLSAFVMQEVDDMKATTGIFDASLGNSANEVTGRAILARKEQSNLTTMHYLDNLARSFKQGGEIIAEVVPKIYDTEREIAILGLDEKQKVVKINQDFKDNDGKVKNHDIANAKMDFVVTMERAFDTKRKETFDTMQQALQTSPNLLPMVGDILFRNYDGAGADQLAERFHKMLPPQLQDNEKNPLPPEAQAVVAQAQQQVQQIMGDYQKLQFERAAKIQEGQNKAMEIQLKSQADLALEDKKLAVQVAVAEINTKAQSAEERQLFVQDIVKTVLKEHSDLLKQHHSQAHDVALQAHQQMHEKQMAAVQHAQALEAADQQAQNASAQSAQDAAQSQAAQQAQGAD